MIHMKCQALKKIRPDIASRWFTRKCQAFFFFFFFFFGKIRKKSSAIILNDIFSHMHISYAWISNLHISYELFYMHVNNILWGLCAWQGLKSAPASKRHDKGLHSSLTDPTDSEPSLQQHLFPKTLPLKLICCCTRYLMSRLICKKDHILFLFPYRTYVLDIC